MKRSIRKNPQDGRESSDRTFRVVDRETATKYWSHYIDDDGKCHTTETHDMAQMEIIVSKSTGISVSLRRREIILPYPPENADPCAGFEFLVEVNRDGYLQETTGWNF